MDWDKITPELERKLDPAHVKPPPKGKFGEYVDGYHVVTEANRIFGHGGWSYTVTRLEKVSEQLVTREGRDGPYEQARVGYMATVRVTIGDTVREGCAVGSGMGNPDDMAGHHEAAVKEAETDALKRALRCFGNTFGLALYDKAKSNVGFDVPQVVLDAAAGAETLDSLRAVWDANANLQTNPGFRDAIKNRKAELQEAA